MKVRDVWTFFGAIIVLSALGIVARNPSIVFGTLDRFNTLLGTAARG